MTKLGVLHDQFGQSPWIDNLTRDWLDDGTLHKLVDQGIRGLTSNPAILAKSIAKGQAYNQQLLELQGQNIESSYWKIVFRDIMDSSLILLPIYQASGGEDGFVSVEVDPRLARDRPATEAAVMKMRESLPAPNILIKIPSTKQGLGAIRASIASGVSINATLIFSLTRYREVMEAYISGLEELSRRSPEALSTVRSVASFFVSRTDNKVDKYLSEMNAPTELRGLAAIAQAKLAYQLFLEYFSTPRWEALAEMGAHVQRPLWASTSTKDPTYPELMYVENLIGARTVNTMADSTLEAFLDQGRLETSITRDLGDARSVLEQLEGRGIHLEAVANELESEGVTSFADAHLQLLGQLGARLLPH